MKSCARLAVAGYSRYGTVGVAESVPEIVIRPAKPFSHPLAVAARAFCVTSIIELLREPMLGQTAS